MGNQGVNKTQLTVSKVSKQHTALLLAPSDAADHQSTSRPGGLASCPAGSSQFSGLTFQKCLSICLSCSCCFHHHSRYPIHLAHGPSPQ